MLLRLYHPLLFRDLAAANASVRNNALQLLVDAFPLQDSAASAEVIQPTNYYLEGSSSQHLYYDTCNTTLCCNGSCAAYSFCLSVSQAREPNPRAMSSNSAAGPTMPRGVNACSFVQAGHLPTSQAW